MHNVRFYKTGSGRELVLEWIKSLNLSDRKVIGEDLRMVQIGFPIGLPLCDNLGAGLWEVRSSLPSKREARLIFFHASAYKALVVVHGFIKKTQKTPPADIDLARKRMREFQD
ncbi:type II toxin-antitoxin system RelE/ParE family toxin [Bosea sp. PAMC 26642]|uniref:type II toxin-antitoxin system RelE/ParE family toxin n=1 Tax=Bosea sp. (strain PAMC 26642) TaxID=1792307 RepID=UPI0007702E55|nr:type II toxin-antitoxin system RelE/ParE family toxin [Bosea sp. PAMC 26642]AMJ61303.1 hypothetical protein AXW83_14260 [Bosea sp. PAMC 26642]